MKTLYLHIGMHKTATSSLQSFLLQNKEKLMNIGFYYPTEGSYYSTVEHGQHSLAHAIKGVIPDYLGKSVNFSKESCVNDIRKDISENHCNNIIVSSEHFCNARTKEDVQAIQSVFAPVISDVKVIVYLRRQDKRFESGYNQQVKMAQTSESFPDYVEKHLSDPDTLYYYHHLLECFSGVFGKENIIVRPFERRQLYKENVIFDFLEIVGIKFDTGFSVPEPHNESIPVELAEIMRAINKNMEKYGHRLALNYYLLSLPLQIDRNQYTLCSAELRDRIINTFENDNRLVAKEYLGIDNDRLFQEPVTNDIPYYKGLSKEKLAQVSMLIWVAEENQKLQLKKMVNELQKKLENEN